MNPAHNLLQLLQLQTVSPSQYLGQPEDIGWNRLYGGHLMAQALAASRKDASPKQQLHAMHCHFLRLGDCRQEILYKTATLRSGMSASVIQVQAFQQTEIIFHLTASYQQPQTGLEYQKSMPAVPLPDDLPTDAGMLAAFVSTLPANRKKRVPAVVFDRINNPQAVQIKPIHPQNFLLDSQGSPLRQMWIRIAGDIPGEQGIHKALLAYASDFSFIGTTLQPHNIHTLSPKVRVASLDHSLRFFRPFKINKWLLFSTHCTNTFGGRGVVNGDFFDQQGHLIASCSQEGIIRKRR